MAATGGMLGTGASAFGGAGALSGLGLEGAGLGMEGAHQLECQHHLRRFRPMSMGPPELAGSFWGGFHRYGAVLQSAAWIAMGDRAACNGQPESRFQPASLDDERHEDGRQSL